MEQFIEVECPFCGFEGVVPVDPFQADLDLVSDCENCCRPFRLNVSMESGEISGWSVSI